jgi:hypothetical protein
VLGIILSSLHGLTFISTKHFHGADDVEERDADDEESNRPLLSGGVGDLDHEPIREYGAVGPPPITHTDSDPALKREHRARMAIYRLIVGKGFASKVVRCIAAVLWAILVVHTIGFGFSAKGPSASHLALWDSPTYGLFEPADSEENSTATHPSNQEKEHRAFSYAKSCYTSPSDPACTFFAQPAINSERKDWNTCPFPDVASCLNHEWSPYVNFDTLEGHNMHDGGLPRYLYKDAWDLGINVKSPYRWRRMMNCVPLSMDAPYVTEEIGKDGKATYKYKHLQPLDNSSDYVWSTKGDPFEDLAAGYTVRAFTTHYNLTNEIFAPHPGIAPFYQSRLTVIYISAGHVLYNAPSTDPLFPADTPIFRDNVTYWRKSDPRATAMACADVAEVCDEWFCQHISLPFSWQENLEAKAVDLWMLKEVLKNSDAHHAISNVQGDALLASELIHEGVSSALSEDHWMQEAWLLFNTTLAWAQFATFNIANGTGSELDGYENCTPAGIKDKLRRIFKFRAEGTRNVLIWTFALCVLSWPVAFMLSWRLSSIRSTTQSIRKCSTRKRGSRNGKGIVRTGDGANGLSSRGIDGVEASSSMSPIPTPEYEPCF